MAAKLTLGGGIGLVTGAAGGIGKQCALTLAEAGVRAVVFADIVEQAAQEAAKESLRHAKNEDYRAIHTKVDVTDENSVQDMVNLAIKEFGRIDYSINSAGIGNLSTALTPDISLELFQRTMEVNVTGTMLCNRAVINIMVNQEPSTYENHRGKRILGRGCIVNLGSVNSYVAVPGMLSYTTSKHAVIGLTKSAAIDTLKSHIRVNAVCPSWVSTPMLEEALQRQPELQKVIQSVSPLSRAATMEEVADYVVYLCSPSASYINGTALHMDAGATLTAQI